MYAVPIGYEFSYKFRTKYSYNALSYIKSGGCQDLMFSTNDRLTNSTYLCINTNEILFFNAEIVNTSCVDRIKLNSFRNSNNITLLITVLKNRNNTVYERTWQSL